LPPPPAAVVPNLTENSPLYNRETIEKRLDGYKNLLEEPQQDGPEEPPKSWIQLKAAAI